MEPDVRDEPESLIPFGEKYSPESITVIELNPERGRIYDCRGKLLVKKKQPIGFSHD